MRSVILHGHIFKNAGTTFDWSLRRNFGDGFLDHRDDKAMRHGEGQHIRALLETQSGLQAISSHHMTGDLPDMPEVHFLRISLLRHPLDRMRSVYDFERKQRGKTPGSKAALSKSFRDYVAWRMSPKVAHTIRNYQTLYLAGFHGLADDADQAGIHLPRALQFLEQATLIGLVDRYDESMVVLEEVLRPFFPDVDLACVPQNVADGKRGSPSAEKRVAGVLDDLGQLQKTVVDRNSFDLALYQLASQRLQQKILAVQNFDDKLAGYRERCRRLRRKERVRFF